VGPVHDAPSPVSFERNTVLGPLLSMAGCFEVQATAPVSGQVFSFVQRDPTGLPDRVGRAAMSVSIGIILEANPTMQQHLERCCPMKFHQLGGMSETDGTKADDNETVH
jgi:hypothetical protein